MDEGGKIVVIVLEVVALWAGARFPVFLAAVGIWEACIRTPDIFPPSLDSLRHIQDTQFRAHNRSWDKGHWVPFLLHTPDIFLFPSWQLRGESTCLFYPIPISLLTGTYLHPRLFSHCFCCFEST